MPEERSSLNGMYYLERKKNWVLYYCYLKRTSKVKQGNENIHPKVVFKKSDSLLVHSKYKMLILLKAYIW